MSVTSKEVAGYMLLGGLIMGLTIGTNLRHLDTDSFSFVERTPHEQFHRAAERWCESAGGSFWNGELRYMAKLPECVVEDYKGKARIPNGRVTWEFSYHIDDYDTGETTLFVGKKGERQSNLLTYITKGKAN